MMHTNMIVLTLLSCLLGLFRVTQAWTFRLVLPAIPHFNMYNPSTLPCSTHATLFKMGTTLTADITRRNTMEFSNLEQGSYLLTVTTRDWNFAPARVDVNTSSVNAEGKKEARVDVWQTFGGNEWGNKGEYRGGGAVNLSKEGKKQKEEENVIAVEVKPLGTKEYYLQRAGFSPLQFLRSPMILMAVFSLALIVGLPYLMENSKIRLCNRGKPKMLTYMPVDDDTKAEFEEMQKQGVTGRGAVTNPAESLQNFDLAGWMAGKSTSSGGGENKKK